MPAQNLSSQKNDEKYGFQRLELADTPQVENPFSDVKEGKYYFNAVTWAINHNFQITKGVDDTHFSPNQTCTRGQVVTFLYNALK